MTGISAKDRIAQARNELAETESIELALPEPLDFLVATYKPLGWRLAVKITEQNDKIKDSGDKILLSSIDVLVRNNLGLAIKEEDGSLTDQDATWVTAATDPNLFNLSLPDNATARQKMQAIFDTELLEECLVNHASELAIRSRDANKKVDAELTGE